MTFPERKPRVYEYFSILRHSLILDIFHFQIRFYFLNFTDSALQVYKITVLKLMTKTIILTRNMARLCPYGLFFMAQN